MTNKVEFAEIVVPMYRCSTDCEVDQYRASTGPRTDVPILVANKKKKKL